MLSWNTLTPHYSEDVIYALNAASVAKHFGMDPASAQARAHAASVHVDATCYGHIGGPYALMHGFCAWTWVLCLCRHLLLSRLLPLPRAAGHGRPDARERRRRERDAVAALRVRPGLEEPAGAAQAQAGRPGPTVGSQPSRASPSGCKFIKEDSF